MRERARAHPAGQKAYLEARLERELDHGGDELALTCLVELLQEARGGTRRRLFSTPDRPRGAREATAPGVPGVPAAPTTGQLVLRPPGLAELGRKTAVPEGARLPPTGALAGGR